MEAPEKIYADPEVFSISDEFNDLLRTKEDGYIEYIQTEAFIEKACAFIRERLIFDDDAWYTDGELTLKDKVINTFKSYMKGE